MIPPENVPSHNGRGQHRLERTTFETSRVLEYFTERELQFQTGRPKRQWPQVVLKELVDNALDAAEAADLSPDVAVVVDDSAGGVEITVTGNGPGLGPETVERILDFSTRTSDKEAYVSPTRGAQGNALKTIIAMPYVLSTNPKCGRVTIVSRGVCHEIEIATDVLREAPRIQHEQRPDPASKDVTSVRLRLDYTSVPGAPSRFDFHKLLRAYALFNPHASFSLLVQGDAEERWSQVSADWQKWSPADPTSPWWYAPDDLGRLIAAHAVKAAGGDRDLPLREFVEQFRGLSSTRKQKAITAQFTQKRLSEFVRDGELDTAAIASLLTALQAASRPVKPEQLGVLGEAHLRARLEAWYDLEPDCLRYMCMKGFEGELPFVLEVALAKKNEGGLERYIGLNFSPMYPGTDPFAEMRLQHDEKRGIFAGTGVQALLHEFKVAERDPLVFVMHLAFPRPRFRDRGKTGLEVAS
jgi:DNA topoisomerase VI subunit B